MIGDDHVDPLLDGTAHRIDAGDPAVDGDHDLHRPLLQHAIEHFGFQAVTVDQAMRHHVLCVRADGAQDGLQQHDRGDAIDVVVTINQDRFPIANRSLDPLARRPNAVDAPRIVEIFNRRRHEPAVVIVGADSPPQQQRTERWMELWRERRGARGRLEYPGVVDHGAGRFDERW